MKNSLFKKFNPDILTMSQEEVDSLKAGFYWDGTDRFSTTEEAFNYFVKVGNKLREPEIYLTNALSFTNDTLSRRLQLQKYLSCENIAYPEYAHYLLKDSLEAVLPSNRLIVLDNVYAKIRIGKYDIDLSPVSFDTTSMAKQMLDSLLIKMGEARGVLLPDLKRTDLKKYRMLSNQMNLSFWPSMSYGEPFYLYIMEPQYWYMAKDMGVNQIDFVSCSLFDSERYNKNPEQYWQDADTTVPVVVGRINNSRYINLALSNQSISKEKKPRTVYIRTNLMLNKKKDGFDQIINLIRYHREIFFKINHISMNSLIRR